MTNSSLCNLHIYDIGLQRVDTIRWVRIVLVTVTVREIVQMVCVIAILDTEVSNVILVSQSCFTSHHIARNILCINNNPEILENFYFYLHWHALAVNKYLIFVYHQRMSLQIEMGIFQISGLRTIGPTLQCKRSVQSQDYWLLIQRIFRATIIIQNYWSING